MITLYRTFTAWRRERFTSRARALVRYSTFQTTETARVVAAEQEKHRV